MIFAHFEQKIYQKLEFYYKKYNFEELLEIDTINLYFINYCKETALIFIINFLLKS